MDIPRPSPELWEVEGSLRTGEEVSRQRKEGQSCLRCGVGEVGLPWHSHQLPVTGSK